MIESRWDSKMVAREGREGGDGFLWTKFFGRSNVNLSIYCAMNNQLLPEFSLTAGEYGWSALFLDSYNFFGQQIGLEIHTRRIPNEPKILPPISPNQAVLVQKIARALPLIIKRLEQEFIIYNQEFDPDFREFLTYPHVWLNAEAKDKETWTFVVLRTDNPDFGYHAEFKDVEFIELWSGD